MDNQLIEKVKKECFRIEEDALYSSKSHYNASSPWEKLNLIIGIPIAILAAVAGLTALKNMPTTTIIISFVLTSLTALNTALNPSKRASQYKSAAGDYNNLKNDVRIFRELELFETKLTDKEIKEKINVFSDRRNQLNKSSPTIPRWAYKQTQSDFKNDFVRYEIDKEKS
ncbi:SLATT domain-containing protein [Serratia sp. JSRIV001]|uniref:SLATT domain-containing protein n=1 Tax=Serratia sp. JSRIV001 TaxID=2831893 RepID=UPI001CBF145F|nr:SLATT domain-containing protein [Serratia sp. JSRIV001]UAN48162.1 SLATT domain-containing protein [Serratia sp. JSRIV001]